MKTFIEPKMKNILTAISNKSTITQLTNKSIYELIL